MAHETFGGQVSVAGFGESVQEVAKLAHGNVKTVTLKDGREVALVPDGFQALPLSGRADLPAPFTAIKAQRTFHIAQSFGDYVARYKSGNTLLLADIDKGEVQALIDYHGPDAPERVIHKASLDLKPSDEWLAWDALEGSFHDQDEFLVFLEQHASDVVQPDQATIMEIVRDFAATQSVVFKSARRLDNGDRQFVYEDETKLKGELVVPAMLHVEIPLYRGSDLITLRCHFRYRINNGGLKLAISWHRAFETRRAAFEAEVTRAAEIAGLVPFYGEADG